MYLCTANFAPIAQVPVKCQRLLESLTAARILQYSGDPSFQVFQAQAEQEKKDLINVLSPRIDGSPRKIPIRNRLWGPCLDMAKPSFPGQLQETIHLQPVGLWTFPNPLSAGPKRALTNTENLVLGRP